MEKRALQLASVASMIDQFNIPNIQILQSLGYKVDVVADFTHPGTITAERAEDLKKRLADMNVRVFDIPIPRSLNPKAIFFAYKQVKELLDKENYTLLHCHSPIGGVIARQAAKGRNGLKVIYTAHGFHFYDGAPLKNWLIFYPIEKYYSRYTDVLITINKEDYKRASEKFHAKKTVYILGVGVDTEKFKPRENGRERIRTELGLKDDQILLLSVGELNENKNHVSVIKAIQGLKLVYVIVGKGEKKDELERVAKEQGDDVRLVGFRSDVADFYDAADMYILPSIREGLNVSLMEAMASSLPCLAGRIRGNVDLIDEKGGYLFDPVNVEEIRTSVEKCIENRVGMGEHNLQKIRNFDLTTVHNLTSEIYRGRGGYEHLVEVLKRQEKRREIGVPINAFLLMSVGELNENKNHSVILKAIANIERKDIHYAIAGKGKLEESLKALAEELGIGDRVHILGFHSDIPELYHASDVCVFPSIREGLGLAAVEGMASGLPLIVSDNRGTRSFVSSENGVVCKYDDADGFAVAIMKLYKSETCQKKLGDHNSIECKKYDLKEVKMQMKDIYANANNIPM